MQAVGKFITNLANRIEIIEHHLVDETKAVCHSYLGIEGAQWAEKELNGSGVIKTQRLVDPFITFQREATGSGGQVGKSTLMR
jgi:hypothetical protein